MNLIPLRLLESLMPKCSIFSFSFNDEHTNMQETGFKLKGLLLTSRNVNLLQPFNVATNFLTDFLVKLLNDKLILYKPLSIKYSEITSIQLSPKPL